MSKKPDLVMFDGTRAALIEKDTDLAKADEAGADVKALHRTLTVLRHWKRARQDLLRVLKDQGIDVQVTEQLGPETAVLMVGARLGHELGVI